MNGAREEVRSRHRPERVLTLFVGESPPANGHFIYDGDNPMCREYEKALGPVDTWKRRESSSTTSSLSR